MPPRFRFAKKTLMTAYAMRMMQNSTMIGLVTEPKPPTCVVAKSTKFSTVSSSMIFPATVPKLAPAPLMAYPKFACKDTQSS